MKRRVLTLALATVLAAPTVSRAQSTKLAHLLPTLYGPQGLFVDSAAPLPDGSTHSAHFNNAFHERFSQFNAALASQLSALPLPAPSSGFTYTMDADARRLHALDAELRPDHGRARRDDRQGQVGRRLRGAALLVRRDRGDRPGRAARGVHARRRGAGRARRRGDHQHQREGDAHAADRVRDLRARRAVRRVARGSDRDRRPERDLGRHDPASRHRLEHDRPLLRRRQRQPRQHARVRAVRPRHRPRRPDAAAQGTGGELGRRQRPRTRARRAHAHGRRGGPARLRRLGRAAVRRDLVRPGCVLAPPQPGLPVERREPARRQRRDRREGRPARRVRLRRGRRRRRGPRA